MFKIMQTRLPPATTVYKVNGHYAIDRL